MERRAIRTIDYRLGETITLDDLRAVVEGTADIDGSSVILIDVETGQRDARYYHLVITEA